MNTNDLMIGDWVTMFGVPYKIAAINKSGVRFDMRDGFSGGAYDAIEPILITPEILEKNGYKRTKGGKLMGLHVADVFNLEISNEYGGCQLRIELQDFGSTEATHWYIGIRGRFSFSGYIGYLHQLQHIYGLCGVEKDIEL